ncbi:hypothetical protein BO78DRAFT_418964 [Aspergillus sclerotiicarbonarius CBS 121057]|uniref:Uncharacterized protein n=1 Tax=Aspergillus sclerotiicarbonarius (strain CBS 121057 / IBT 28362) TaxID=1448318 RepID=A0A319E7G5_ASPSB|nr:hypothetical protein BO78DRAFT_418964 [Aspergillus sclerotiicarbonarius CBS 121057]
MLQLPEAEAPGNSAECLTANQSPGANFEAVSGAAAFFACPLGPSITFPVFLRILRRLLHCRESAATYPKSRPRNTTRTYPLQTKENSRRKRVEDRKRFFVSPSSVSFQMHIYATHSGSTCTGQTQCCPQAVVDVAGPHIYKSRIIST